MYCYLCYNTKKFILKSILNYFENDSVICQKRICGRSILTYFVTAIRSTTSSNVICIFSRLVFFLKFLDLNFSWCAYPTDACNGRSGLERVTVVGMARVTQTRGWTPPREKVWLGPLQPLLTITATPGPSTQLWFNISSSTGEKHHPHPEYTI